MTPETRAGTAAFLGAIFLALAVFAVVFGGAYLAGLGWTLGAKAAWGEPSYEELVE